MSKRANQYSSITQTQVLKTTYDILRNENMPDVWKKDFLKNFTIQHWSENFQSRPSSKLVGNKYMSEGAYQQYTQTMSKCNLHHEHVTTKNLIYDKHFGNHFMDVEIDELEFWLKTCAFACVITNCENKHYLGGKLRQNMPPEFYQKDHPWYMRKWARYLKAGFTDLWLVDWNGDVPKKVRRPVFSETI